MNTSLPTVNNISELDLTSDADALTVAFASLDGDCVDQHFGSSLGFYVFHVSLDDDYLITFKHFQEEKKDGNEDKLKPKLAWLYGCDLVYCGSIGGSATRQLITIGVHPIKVKEGPEIEELIQKLKNDLSQRNNPLLERILQNKQNKQKNRFDEMLEEEWDS